MVGCYVYNRPSDIQKIQISDLEHIKTCICEFLTNAGNKRIFINLTTHPNTERMVQNMSNTTFKSLYDDGNIPQIDLPQDEGNISVAGNSQKESAVIKAGSYSESVRSTTNVAPLPESFRPRKDGPGGE